MNSPATPKQLTAKGAAIAPFTMVVKFKPEFMKCNISTGEIIHEGWTYRSDIEARKLAADGITLRHIMDPLGIIYSRDRHKYGSVKIFNNQKPAGQDLEFYQVADKIIFPQDPDRVARFKRWIKSL